jgi:hypothetical protein
LYAIRNPKEISKKVSNLTFNLVKKSKVNFLKEIEFEKEILNLKKENEKLKIKSTQKPVNSNSESDSHFEMGFDSSGEQTKEKKKRKVKSLMNPSQKRHKASGAKIL